MAIRVSGLRPFAQGDAMFIPVSKEDIPTRYKEVAADEQYKGHVVAHSETGHQHVLEPTHSKHFREETNEFIGYLEITDDSSLTHLRDHHTHEEIIIPAGFYKIVNQREYSMGSYRRAAD